MELQISAWKGSDGRAVSGADVGRMWGGCGAEPWGVYGAAVGCLWGTYGVSMGYL